MPNDINGSKEQGMGQGSNSLTPQLFKRTEVIGRGKFGVVYKAYHAKTKQVYAVKVLNLDCPEDEVEDVQKEIQFLASLKQVPNITRYYGSYLYDTKLWVIMEYCAGGSLRTLLRPGKIDEKYLGVIVRKLLIALVYIHKDNVIHRDIKAANVLITNEGHVKLCDFGVAAQLTAANHKRQTMAGTPYWMAPEVIMDGVYYNTKADIWSLGITAYEIATGNPPYCDVEALRAMQLITKSKPPRLEGRNYSPLLKEFIALCLDEDPEERPTAEDLLSSRFVKAHKGSSATILKELISRYLLFSEKHNRESVLIPLDEDDPQKSANATANGADAQVEMKWDFDSLNSNEYIMQNEISIDAIPQETDWGRTQHEVNYAYPYEETYFHSNMPHYFQGTTVSKTFADPAGNTSTIQALNQHATGTPTTTNCQNKSTFTISQSMKTESKASKQLLQLFEDSEMINEEKESGLPHLATSLSSMHLNENDTAASTPLGAPVMGASIARQDILANGPGYHSQSTPILPMLQTNFKLSVPKSSTTLHTPVEIEIPEELPLSTTTATAAPMGGAASVDPHMLKNKPRSATVSSSTSSGLQRRPTLGSNSAAAARSDPSALNKSLGAELTRTVTLNAHIPPNGPSQGITGAGLSSSISNDRSPSPSRSGAGSNLTPERSTSSIASTEPPGAAAQGQGMLPSAKPVHSAHSSTEGMLQQSLATTSLVPPMAPGAIGPIGSAPGDKDLHPSDRVSREFKRNHPNLKLQMPSPTTLIPNKLLNAGTADEHAAADSNSGGSASSANINQFGINTSSTGLPVAMTPLNEKSSADFGAKLKRSTSTSSRAPPAQPADPSCGLGAAVQPAQPAQPAAAPPAPPATTANSIIVTVQAPLYMDLPPRMLPMDMFVDVDDLDDTHFVDKKPLVLRELDALLKMFEDGLPVMENALKAVLPTHNPSANDDEQR
ncbi:AaceriACL104Cp [[Ashbya] aceris (nom. inval.)]|nr:AaceriACL104Cp [[Ashbya] aceris (nom. inval.)]